MSSPVQTEEDDVEEVEFVSEAHLRPVSEYVDLLSDSDDEGCSSFTMMHEDKTVTREKARVTSTLDRLAHEVEQEKKKREDKCRAFKEKQIQQRAHGQQELAFSSANGGDQEAKRCVDMWLKMPGLKPASISGGFGRRRRSAPFSMSTSTRHTCPVINCGRVYDHASLLDGHLKRFDHSPCDPTIHLKGMPAELFACVACCLHFQTKEAWKKHLESKVSSSSTAGAHSITQIYQLIVAFACPTCYLLFSLKDECLQHMSAKNHFTEAFAKKESQRTPLPVPVPQYVKNRLITLCKEVGFKVRCSLCHKVLLSHQAAQAHFNVYCRQGCAVAKADKTIVQVIKQLQVQGQCSTCCKIFLTQAEIEGHKESTQHDVEMNLTMEKALLQHCRFGPSQENLRAKHAPGEIEYTSHVQKRMWNSESDNSSTKRQRTSRNFTVAWFCECGLSFPEESVARKHILAVNQIFHQCGVCGKLMNESSIARLHMSRFHGGAHLSNFLFYCRKCKVEMPRYEDILLHVSEAHSGHTYFSEQEVSEDVAKVVDSKPSTSYHDPQASSSKLSAPQNTVRPSSSTVRQTWMCGMCEDTFDSEVAVRLHCSDVNKHSFQRFICGHCPQKFFKESTVRRHCLNEHPGQMKSFHFCGLCDSMQFDTEAEFLEHYERLHSTEYCCLNDDVAQPTVDESVSQLTCLCMSSKKSKKERKAIYTKCMKKLATEGKCLYVCAPCGLSVPNYAQMKTHVHTKHAALNLDKTFNIQCTACPEGFVGVPDFHNHYHSQHCELEPCVISRSCNKEIKTETTTGNTHDAVEVNSEKNDGSDEEMKHTLSMSEDAKESAEATELSSGRVGNLL